MATKPLRGGHWNYWDSAKTGTGTLGEKTGRRHGPPNTPGSEFRSVYGAPKQDLTKHYRPPDDRAAIALIARRADRVAEISREGSSDYRLQVPYHLRDPVKLRRALDRNPLGVAGDLERSLGINLSEVRRMPSSERRGYIVSQSSQYLSHHIPKAIVNEMAGSPVKLVKGRMIDKASGSPTENYKEGHKGKGYTGHLLYQLAAAVIGITILLILGTSFLTGEITGASITALDESPQFPFTLFFFIIVAFLFGLLWQHASKPLEIQ